MLPLVHHAKSTLLRRRRRASVFREYAIAAALLVFAFGCSPPPRPRIIPRVNGKRAFQRVAEFVRLGPRPSGSPGAEAAARYLAAQCRKLGFHPKTETWTEDTPAGSLRFRNVSARKPGRSRAWILVASHYDTKVLPECPDFVGANDSGSSTGLLLEIMHVLGPRPWPGPSLVFAFFDGEECRKEYGPHDGLHGSRRFAEEIRRNGRARSCRAMILLDMVGDRNLDITLSPDTPRTLAQAVFRAAADLGRRNAVGYFLNGAILDDHTPFRREGIPAVDLIDFDYGPNNAWWHTGEDTLDKLSPKSLAFTGDLCLRLLWRIAWPEQAVQNAGTP